MVSITRDIQPDEYVFTINRVNTTYQGIKGGRKIIVTNEDLTVVWDSIVQEIGSNQAEIKFGRGEFEITSTLDFDSRSNLFVSGLGDGTSRIKVTSTLADDDSVFRATKTQTGTSYDLDATTLSSQSVTTSTAADAGNFAEDDYVLVYNDDDITGEIAGRKEGFLMKVSGVNAGTGVITLYDKVERAFDAPSNPKIVKIDMNRNIKFRGLTFEDERTSPSSSIGNGLIYLEYIENALVTECSFTNCVAPVVGFKQLFNCRVTDCSFTGHENNAANSQEYAVVGSGGVGLMVADNVIDCEGARSGIISGAGTASDAPYTYGYLRGYVVTGNIIKNCTSSAIDCHEGVRNTIISNNFVLNEGDGSSGPAISCRGFHCLVSNNMITNSYNGIVLTDNSFGTLVTGNRINTCDTGVQFSVSQVCISGNFFQSCTTADISGGSSSGYSIVGNHHSGSAPHFSGTSTNPTGVLLEAGDEGLDFTHVDDADEAGFRIKNSDGGYEFVNNTGTAGEYLPQMRFLPNGDTRGGEIVVRIPPANDVSNTNPILKFNLVQNDTGFPPISSRNILYSFENDGTPVFAIRTDSTLQFPVRTDGNRGSAGTAGRVIFNSTDGQLNIDDGTNWTLPDGTTT